MLAEGVGSTAATADRNGTAAEPGGGEKGHHIPLPAGPAAKYVATKKGGRFP